MRGSRWLANSWGEDNAEARLSTKGGTGRFAQSVAFSMRISDVRAGLANSTRCRDERSTHEPAD